MIKGGQLRQHIESLEAFERDYRRYIQAQEADRPGPPTQFCWRQRKAL